MASLEPFIDTLVICTMTGLVIVTTDAWRDAAPQSFGLDEVEGIHRVLEDDSGLLAARDERAGVGGGVLEVVDGTASGSFVFLNATIVDARLVDGEGSAWSGRLELGADGSLRTEAAEPRIEGGALLNGAPLTARAFSLGLPGSRGDLIVTLSVLLFAVSTAISWSYYGDRSTEYLFGARAIPVYRWIYVGFFFMGCLLPLTTVWTFGDVALGLMSFPKPHLAAPALGGGHRPHQVLLPPPPREGKRRRQ